EVPIVVAEGTVRSAIDISSSPRDVWVPVFVLANHLSRPLAAVAVPIERVSFAPVSHVIHIVRRRHSIEIGPPWVSKVVVFGVSRRVPRREPWCCRLPGASEAIIVTCHSRSPAL